MGKNNCSKQDSKPDQNGQPNDQNQPKVNCILHFKDLKPSDDSIKTKFYEADETKVCPNKSESSKLEITMLI
jgi:hypothetical protein